MAFKTYNDPSPMGYRNWRNHYNELRSDVFSDGRYDDHDFCDFVADVRDDFVDSLALGDLFGGREYLTLA